MEIKVSGRHIDITAAIREYASEKVLKLPRYYDRVQEIDVVLDRRGPPTPTGEGGAQDDARRTGQTDHRPREARLDGVRQRRRRAARQAREGPAHGGGDRCQ